MISAYYEKREAEMRANGEVVDISKIMREERILDKLVNLSRGYNSLFCDCMPWDYEDEKVEAQEDFYKTWWSGISEGLTVEGMEHYVLEHTNGKLLTDCKMEYDD